MGVVCEDPRFGRALAAAAAAAPGTVALLATERGARLRTLLDAGPEVLVVDETTSRWEEVRRALERRAAQVIVVTADEQPASVHLVVSGVDAIVPAVDATSLLPLVVATVARGQTVLPRGVLDAVLDRVPDVVDVAGAERLERLTAREREVLEHLMAGDGQRQIAADLHVSVHTVRFHVKQILAKLGVRSSLEAAMVASRAGFSAEDGASSADAR